MMKRSALVEYTSSGESDNDSGPELVSRELREPEAQPPAKKLRRLPSLSAHLLPQTPTDNPALHQGRRRTVPHVEGQFAAHVYVPLYVHKDSRLFKLLLRVFSSAKRFVSSLQPIGFAEGNALPSGSLYSTSVVPDESPVELHISLTRPTYLRAHQREEFKRAVRLISKAKRKFSASFATISELTNDERTRTFLTLEVGAGHDELKTLSEGLSPTLRALRQKEFYEDPRFHVSIAWALLDGSQHSLLPSASASSPPNDSPPSSRVESDTTVHHTPGAVPVASPAEATFATIPCFEASLIPRLQAEFSKELVQSGVGIFDVEEIHVRIGKEVNKWRLAD